jgi:nucleotide-binding universal stress UspA family protein
VVCLLSHARRGLERVLVGSVTEKVLRCCEAPVLVIRIPQDRPLVD